MNKILFHSQSLLWERALPESRTWYSRQDIRFSISSKSVSRECSRNTPVCNARSKDAFSGFVLKATGINNTESVMQRFAIIMAGGVGERLWPLSRRHRPKQLLSFGFSESLLQQTVQRLLPIIDAEHIWVITSTALLDAVRTELRSLLPAANVYAEPAKRNTAGCVAYATALLQSRYPDTPISVGIFPADHFIHPAEPFHAAVTTAFAAVESQPVIATIGIRPRYPATGYGYIEVESEVSEGTVIPVRQFREKPDRATAERFLQTSRFLWNSGMFFWSLQTIISTLETTAPAIGQMLPKMVAALQQQDTTALATVFHQLPNISIDYAVMEKATNLVVVPASFQWSDIGSLSALADILPRDSAGNATQGKQLFIVDSQSNILWNTGSTPVVTLGVEDLIVVALEDVIFICRKDQAQQVRKVVQYLRDHGQTDLIE